MPYDKFVIRSSRPAARPPDNPAAAYYEVLRTPEMACRDLDATVPRRAVQLQQVPRPPLRALDAEPVLPAWPPISRRIERKPAPGSGMTEDRQRRGPPEAKRRWSR